jgi:uncharacterized protein (DUF736 family)
MAQIGTFRRNDDGSFVGVVRTLTFDTQVRFIPIRSGGDKAPDLRAYVGAGECGAAWQRTAKDSGREFFSVKLDDPSFAAPVHASLVESNGGGWSLLWSRPDR